MRVVFLVPRRADGGQRDRLWEWARRRWESIFPDWPIYEGHHDEGPFNRSAAVNLAADLADEDGHWDVGIVIDSDVFLRRSDVLAAVERATETGRVTWPHTRWRGINETWTKRILDDRRDFGPEIDHDDMDVLVERTNPLSWSCCIAIPRAVFDDLGGFDERFRGWGFEDMAFQSVVVGLYGFERLRGDVYHLWHPRSEERIVKGEPAITASADYVDNGRLGRRYMVALRRDHGRHDRMDVEWAPGERERDIANLVKDDARFEVLAKRHGRPDWSDWWPTLEELRDGAKAARFGAVPGVAVVVRTGGNAETWEERSGYLRRSLESLNERVSGPIEQRVVYSDWGDEHRAELDAIVSPLGYYVVGAGHHGYTASTRRLWRYIETRVRTPYVFLAEDDFLFDRDVDLVPMIDVLRKETRLRQIALLRAPAYPREIEQGGILGWPEEEFTRIEGPGARLEHRLFWTMNPSLFRRSLVEYPWPQKVSSERAFGDLLLRDPRARFAFWGTGEPWLTHIGEVRASDAY